jgi:hypothetical protein
MTESNGLSDLVQRLRRGVVIHVYDEHHTLNSSTPLEIQAADAIEALEAKLRGTEWVWKEAKEQHRLCWESFKALEAENEKLYELLDDVWQDLHTIKSHVQIAVRRKSP